MRQLIDRDFGHVDVVVMVAIISLRHKLANDARFDSHAIRVDAKIRSVCSATAEIKPRNDSARPNPASTYPMNKTPFRFGKGFNGPSTYFLNVCNIFCLILANRGRRREKVKSQLERTASRKPAKAAIMALKFLSILVAAETLCLSPPLFIWEPGPLPFKPIASDKRNRPVGDQRSYRLCQVW